METPWKMSRCVSFHKMPLWHDELKFLFSEFGFTLDLFPLTQYSWLIQCCDSFIRLFSYSLCLQTKQISDHSFNPKEKFRQIQLVSIVFKHMFCMKMRIFILVYELRLHLNLYTIRNCGTFQTRPKQFP